MAKRIKMDVSKKIISTKQTTNYSIIFKDYKLLGILLESPTESSLYFFEPKGKKPEVSDELVENALRTLLGTNPSDFDFVYSCFHSLKQKEHYCNIAIKVYKEFCNTLLILSAFDDTIQDEGCVYKIG